MKNIGLKLGALAIALRLLFAVFPELSNSLYLHGIYPHIAGFLRKLFGAVVPLAPIILSLAFAFLLFLLVKFFASFFRGKTLTAPSKGPRTQGLKILNFLGFLSFLFLFSWGFNYANPTIAQKNEMKQPGVDVLSTFFESRKNVWAKAALLANQNGYIPNETVQIKKDHIAQIKLLVADVLINEKVKVPLKVNMVPHGFLREIGIQGIYFPFTAEANVDESLYLLSGLFTTAHELAHSLGVTDEGEANFIAYVALMQSKNALFEYAAHYALWRYMHHELINLGFAPETLKTNISELLNADLDLNRLNNSKHRGRYAKYSAGINSFYLKAQGVKKGVASYNEFVGLACAWELASRPKIVW